MSGSLFEGFVCGILAAGAIATVGSAIGDGRRQPIIDAEKAKLTEAYNALSVPDKVLLVQKAMAEVDCNDTHGVSSPMFPAPTRTDQITTALTTYGCRLVPNGLAWNGPK